MAVRLLVAAALLAVLAGGCVIREIREIHHEPGESQRCAACANNGSGAPGSLLADSQPPAPMVEEAGLPPAQDYVWVDGYWHWDGAEWIWIAGRWVPPMGEFVFVPPAYYATGDDCVYVPGYWQRGPRSPWPIRDKRVISVGGHKHKHRPRIYDHRGDKPRGAPGSLTGDDRDDGIVVTIPSKPPRPPAVAQPPSRPVAAPSSPSWRAPGSSPPSSAPPRPSSPPSSSPPRAAPPSSPARAAPPSSPPRAAPSSPPPRSAPPASPPSRPAQSAGGGGHHKKK